MKPHLVPPDAGSDSEVWTVRDLVLHCTMEPPVEVCLGLSEGSYCVSAFCDSQAYWASVLWMVDLLQGHSAPQSHPEWNPRAQDHLQRKQTSDTEWGWFLHHTLKVCRALWWWLTSPGKYSSLLQGFLCPAEVLSLDAGVTSGPGGVQKNTFKLLKFQNRHFHPAITKM